MNGVDLVKVLDLPYVLFTVGATLIVGHQRHHHLKMNLTAKAKRQQYCKFCRISGHNTDDYPMIDETYRHVSKSRSRSVSRSSFKDSKGRAVRHSSKDRSASCGKKSKTSTKDARPSISHSYTADSDAEGESTRTNQSLKVKLTWPSQTIKGFPAKKPQRKKTKMWA